jgi:hypothetical protein
VPSSNTSYCALASRQGKHGELLIRENAIRWLEEAASDVPETIPSV